MISMSKAYSIRQLRMEGDSIAEISRKLEVSRDTVNKYLAADDLSPKPPQPRRRQSSLDRYRPLIESWLDEDERSWRKQRHTAHRIWVRLRDEAGADVGESTVRNYVRRLRLERGTQREQYLDLDWAPGDAQADFGEADFYVGGVRRRMSFFVMTFPYSNVGVAQVFPGENAECVCQALRNVFEHVAGVPRRIVFDNAAGVGRRVGDAVRTTEMFSAFAAHYGFAYSFCNPHSGHEKGSVENKVRSALLGGLREHMDSLGGPDLRAELRLMRDQAAASGWAATVQAMAAALAATGRVDRASVAVGAARIAGGAVSYDEAVDLSAYDSALASARGR